MINSKQTFEKKHTKTSQENTHTQQLEDEKSFKLPAHLTEELN